MGELLQHQESHVYMRDFRGCKWAPFFNLFDFHRRFNLRKLLSDKKHLDRNIVFSGNKYLPLTSQPLDSMDPQKPKSGKPKTGKMKSRILKSFIPSKFFRKQDSKMLPLSPKLLRTISIHHLENNDYVQNNGTNKETGTVPVKKEYSSKSENILYRLPKYQLSSIQEIDVKKSLSLPSEMRHKTQNNLKFEANLDPNLVQNNSKNQIEKSLKQIISKDGLLHKIPYGQNSNSKNSKDLNLFRSSSVNYERERPKHLMQRSHSLSDKVDRYAHLFDSLSLSREERESASKTVQNASKTVQNASEIVKSASKIVQEDIENFEMSEKHEDNLDLRREKEEERESDEKIESDKHEDNLDLRREKEEERESDEKVKEKESPVSVLDHENFQNLQEIDISFDAHSPQQIYENTPQNIENSPTLTKDLNLENLMGLFENFGFSNEDFSEIFESLLQEVQNEIYNFTNFDYDENMSLDQNILYALTHECLLEIFEKYFSNNKITKYVSVPLENVLFKDLWRKINRILNSKVCLSENIQYNNLIERNILSDLKDDAWLDLSRDRESLGVELGNMIFESLLEELIF